MTDYTLKNGQTLSLRQGRGTDAAACLAFLRCVGNESDYLLIGPEGLRDTTEQQEADYLESRFDSPDKRLFLGFVDGELVCVANVEINSHPRLCHNASMGVSVRRRLWGQGAGSACLEQIIAFCRASGGVKNLCLEVFADNVRAIGLYQKFGFVCDGCRKKRLRVGKVYHDEALMRLSL